MKFFLLNIGLLFLSTACIYGQNSGEIGPQNFIQKAEQEVNRMAGFLQLDTARKDSAFAVTKWYYQQIALLKAQDKTIAERGVYLQQYETGWKDALARILTTVQYTAYMERRASIALRIQQRIDSLRNSH